MPLTLRDVLRLDAVRAGDPVVVAAADRLDATVRWVHAAEVSDVGRLLRGGELVLSTGIALPASPAGLADYIAGLAGAGVAGLAIELGQRYATALPSALVTAAEGRGLPLIAFERELPFVEITEVVHAQIIDAQLAELRSAQQVHAVFTALSVDGASPEVIVAAAAELARRPVILADLSYRVLASASPNDSAGPNDSASPNDSIDPNDSAAITGVPGDFAARARAACEGRPRTFHAESLLGEGGASPDGSGWLVSTVGARGEDWGRLFLSCPGPPGPQDTSLLERAATTLALGRLLARQAESVERQAHRTLISAIIEDADPASAVARARAMGVPVAGRQLVALVARLPAAAPGLSAQAIVVAVAESLADACRDVRVPALVGSLDDVRVAALLSLPAQSDPDAALRQLSARLAIVLASRPDPTADPVIGVGSPVTGLAEARRSFLDAREVADVAIRRPDGRPYYRLPDLRLRGLVHMLRD